MKLHCLPILNIGMSGRGEIGIIQLTIDYTDTQFEFKFKAPATSTLDIYDGDGTMTQVAGQDDTEVTHTTSYSTPGTYYFYVEGDYADITYIKIANMSFISGDVGRFGELRNLERIYMANSINIFGSISLWNDLPNLTHIFAFNTGLSGDISYLSGSPVLDTVNMYHTNVSGDVSVLATTATLSLLALILYETFVEGDISGFGNCINLNNFQFGRLNKDSEIFGDATVLRNVIGLNLLWLYGTKVSWNNQFTWPDFGGGYGSEFELQDCEFSSTEVDNVLVALADTPITNADINVGGTNAARTSSSDAALVTLEAAGCTVTVNEE